MATDVSYFNTMNALASGGGGLPFDLSKGQPIVALPIDEHEAQAVMPVQQLLSLVPDPLKAEKPKEIEGDPLMRSYAELRGEVQRMVQGAKAKNAIAFGRYLVEGLTGERPFVTPPITLYHPVQLEQVSLGNGQIALILPYGDFFVAIDGETQRLAWQYAANDYPAALAARVKIVVHHGKPLTQARQGFYDLNTREVKPNAAVAIAMDSLDLATQVTRVVMDSSDVLKEGGVNLMRRQLRRSDPELLTISALRTGVVTTILGAPGLQIGSRPIDMHILDEEAGREALVNAVTEVWVGILEQLEDELQPNQRAESVAAAPAVLAGIGVVAHHAVPQPPRRDGVEEWSVEEVVEHLDGVNWKRTQAVDGRETSPWDGIAGKFTPSGRFSIGGPKEVGYAVAEALEGPSSAGGRQIRA